MYIYSKMNQGRKKCLGKKKIMETFPSPNNMRIWKLSRGSALDFLRLLHSCLSNSKRSVSSETVLHNWRLKISFAVPAFLLQGIECLRGRVTGNQAGKKRNSYLKLKWTTTEMAGFVALPRCEIEMNKNDLRNVGPTKLRRRTPIQGKDILNSCWSPLSCLCSSKTEHTK